MGSQQRDGRLILGAAATFADSLQRGLIRAFKAQQKADAARLLLQVQDICIPHDIIGAGGAHNGDAHIFGDQRH